MNMLRPLRGSLVFASALAVGTLLAARPLHAGEPEPGPDALRQEARQLEEKSRDLKQAGQHDEARRTWQKVEALRAEADQREAGARGQDRREQPDRDAMAQKLRDLRRQLDDLREAGRDAEAAETKERIAMLERRMARPDRVEGRPRDRAPGNPELERRMEHLRIAIENLHAAGLHELADRIAREAKSRQRPTPARPPGEVRGPGVARGEVEQLREEMQELRMGLQQLRARLDELGRDRR